MGEGLPITVGSRSAAVATADTMAPVPEIYNEIIFFTIADKFILL